MDSYLPADFHALHDGAPQDWRDISSAQPLRDARSMDATECTIARTATDRCVDPSWQTLQVNAAWDGRCPGDQERSPQLASPAPRESTPTDSP